MVKKVNIVWLNKPEDHDYIAADSYLNLLYKGKIVNEMVSRLKKADITQFKAKDIFRASGLSLLGISNSHVALYRKKIAQGLKISPILLVRDTPHGKVIIADGYHRLCAVYSYDEDAIIPCQII